MRTRLIALCIAVCCGIVGHAASALAVTSTPGSIATAVPATSVIDTASVPLAVGAIDVQLWLAASPGQAISIVSVQLPESVELPARVRIPIVRGSSVEWAGEISGGAVNEDIQRPFTVVEADGASYAEIVLTTYRAGQIDLSPLAMGFTDARRSAEITYVQSVESTSTNFSVRIPPSSKDVRLSPEPEGTPAQNEQGETLYSLGTRTLKLGEWVKITASYAEQGVGDAGSSSSQSANTVIWVLVAGVVLALGALFAVTRRPR